MVKFGRRFFFERTYKKRNWKTPLLILLGILVLCAIIYGICALISYINKKNNQPAVEFKKSVTVELNSEIPTTKDFLKSLKKLTPDDFEIIYPNNLELIADLSKCDGVDDTIGDNACAKTLVNKVGKYKIKFESDKIDGKFSSILKVVDTKKPVLKLKTVTIVEGTEYKIDDFIDSCIDNSEICYYSYADKLDDNGEKVDYSQFKEVGEYVINIYAYDESKNKSETIETKLVITKKEEPKQEENKKEESKNKDTSKNNNKDKKESKKCAYGDMQYSNSYVLAVKINSDCAIKPSEAQSLSLKEAQTFNKVIAKEMSNNYLKAKLESLNLQGNVKINVNYGTVLNNAGKGAVGYFVSTEASQTINGKTTVIEKYFLDTNGHRVWKVDSLNIK